MSNNNIKTMEFVCKDDWGNYVYKCIETGVLYKDVSPEHEKPELYSCGNEIDGEPCYPIKSGFTINFVDRKIPNKAEEFSYMMLSRLQMDCNYFLGNGNGYEGHLWAKNVNEQIEEMKKIYNSFDEDKRPEWLTYDEILAFEKSMLEKLRVKA